MSETSRTISFVCPNCGSVNRVPENRIDDGPICGKCKSRLAPGKPIELTDQSFDPFVSRTSVPVIVDFWAAWCGPCRMMAPAFDEAAKELAPRAILAKLNTEESRRTASGFNITGIPCLIAFRNGKEVARQSGVMSGAQIVQWVRSI
jgi:thioredoxin 2